MNHFELRFSAMLENIGFARTAVASFISNLNPTLEEVTQIKTIVSEAVSNAIIHGYKLNGLKEIFLKVYIIKRQVEIIVQDYGVGIENVDEVLKLNYTTLKEHEHAGMGFTIMQTLSDKFEIQSQPNLGTRLKIVASLSSELEEVY